MINKLNEKQKKLLTATEEVIAIKGYSETTVRDISQNAGVNIALISYYFGSKEGMMLTLLSYQCEKLRSHLSELFGTMAGGLPPMQMRELLRQFVHKMFKILILRRGIMAEFGKPISMSENLKDCLHLLTERIENLVQMGMVSGHFTFMQKAEDLVGMLVGMVFFAFEQETFYSEYIPYQSEVEYFKEVERRVSLMVAFSIFSSLGMAEEK